jgi:hypothetical protein
MRNVGGTAIPNHPFLVADPALRVPIRAKTPSREVPRQQRAQKSLAQHERAAADRDSAIRAAYASGGYTLKAIGEHFGLHYATASRIARAGMWQNKT